MIDVKLHTGSERRLTVRKAVEDLGDDFITKCREAEEIFVHVNLIDSQYQLACTHVDAVRGLLDVIRTYSKTPVKIGDAAYRGSKAAFEHFGYERLLDEYHQVELVDLNEDDFVDGETVREDGSRNPIRRSKVAANAGFKISLAPLKVHKEVGMSASVYTWTTGTWIVPSRISATGRVWAHWPWLEEEGVKAHHESIAELYRQAPCDVAIVDGIMAMQGDGPVQGSAVEMGVVLAEFDAVAVDAVAATLIGFDPSEIGYLKACHESQLGSIDMSQINVPPMQMAELTKQLQRPFGLDRKLGEI